ncbi:MAG: ATP synthase subunit I [Pseudomonadota bacterium]
MAIEIAPQAKRLLYLQVLAGSMPALIVSLWSLTAAISMLVGALIGFLPNAYFALRVFDTSRGRSAQATRSAIYSGAAGKVIVTAALFSVAFLLLSPLHAPALFAGFIAVQLMHWLVLLTQQQ